MKISPELEEFERLSEEADVVLVRAEFTADAETPLSAYAKLSTRKPAFLLESVVGGDQVSRYSFVGCNPRKVIACHEDETVVTERNGERNSFPTPADPLDIVEQEMAGIRYAAIDDLPRFAGGAVGYIGYEYASRIEPTVPLAEKAELGLPTLYFLIADLVLIFDHARQTLSICANAYVGDNPAADYAEAAARIADTVKQLSVPSPLLPAELDSAEGANPPTCVVTSEPDTSLKGLHPAPKSSIIKDLKSTARFTGQVHYSVHGRYLPNIPFEISHPYPMATKCSFAAGVGTGDPKAPDAPCLASAFVSANDSVEPSANAT